MIGIILSIIFPGLGQFYYGKNGRAIAMLILGITPLYPIALVWSIIDIVRLNKKGEAPKFEKKEAIWGIIVLLVIIPICFLILFFGSFTLFNWYSEAYNKPRITMEEGNDIVRALNKYKKEKEHYPEDLQTIISGSPIRARWSSDAWGQSYHYEVSTDKKTFKLISKGKDKTLETEDDIIFE
jgi:TM2 domain-containing membrane protein YozV